MANTLGTLVAPNRDGWVKLAGTLTGGTMAAGGNAVLQMPRNMLPKVTVVGFLRGGSTGAALAFTLNSSGVLTVFNSAETSFGLDMIPPYEAAA